MLTRHTRLLIAFYVGTDAALSMAAFLLAYATRFHAGLPVPKGIPPIEQYLHVAPFIGLLVPVAYQIQGLYRLRRNRTRVDDFFAVFVGTVLALVLGLVGTLYFQAYYVSEELKAIGAYEVSQLVWGFFVIFNIGFTYTTREAVRAFLERRWRAGIGLKRVAIAGAGDLGRLIADKLLEHPEVGCRIVGFIDDKAADDHIGYRGVPLIGTLDEAVEILGREKIDLLYIALPLEAQARMLGLLEAASRECVDVRFVPDLLQFIALRARLEDLDGVPVISINDVPLQGLNTALKRTIDFTLAVVCLALLAVPLAVLAMLVRRSSPGPVFYRQERMGLDGKSFTIYKFRSMTHDAERDTGPVWARENDARRTEFGRFLRRFSLDELPQLLNVLRGDMSIVGPRPERPLFVEEFKHRYPQYMLRHKVKAGITGWAQVNGWRGNTSIEKRIEYDLYYIEHWSLSLDLKIMWLTLVRGFHTHAY
jgi:Undecaprenyl-phosphate glucose phosphotransferase